jgi:hypothetical protein
MPPPSPSWHHVWSLEKLRRHVRASARADRFDFQDAVGLTQILLQIDPLPPRPRSFSRTTARTYLKSQNCLRRMQTAASQNPGVSSVAVLGFSGLHSPPRLHLGFQVAVMRARLSSSRRADRCAGSRLLVTATTTEGLHGPYAGLDLDALVDWPGCRLWHERSPP